MQHPIEDQLRPNPAPSGPPAKARLGRRWLLAGALLALLLLSYASYRWIATRQGDAVEVPGTQTSPTPVASPTSSPTPTPTPDPMAGWKTYTSSAGDYTIKYPPEWMVTTSSVTQTTLQSPQLTFTVNRGSVNPGAGSPDTVNKYTVTVDGQAVAAKEYIFSEDPTNAFFVIFEAKHGDQTYTFRWIGKKGLAVETARSLLRQMLSTFRFAL